ncbi:hypothetical protein V5O48_005444 [Marasmius crinis-equi]|uniref:DUF6534 domain-containing protein n=1 Tax=Marasmius crinis-equi TaxID=585013 RepID=A0ABR3FN49_9AGAR
MDHQVWRIWTPVHRDVFQYDLIRGYADPGRVFASMRLSCLLSGIVDGDILSTVQKVRYFSDHVWIRYFASIIELVERRKAADTLASKVLYLLLAETVGTGLFFAMMYDPLVLNSGRPEIQIRSPFLLRTDGPITALIATPVQIFMAWRIKVISGSKLLTFLISVLSLASLAGGIWTGVGVAQNPDFKDFVHFQGAPGLWLVSAAVSDVLIATSLVVFLVKRKSSFISTNDQIDRIVRLTVQTGTITAVAALADAIVFLAAPHTTVFFIWDLSLSKLYSNSVLSSLNARGWGAQNGNGGGAPTSVLFASNLDGLSAFESDESSTVPRTPTSTLPHHSRSPPDTLPGDIELGIPHRSIRSLSDDGTKDGESPTDTRREVHVSFSPSRMNGAD